MTPAHPVFPRVSSSASEGRKGDGDHCSLLLPSCGSACTGAGDEQGNRTLEVGWRVHSATDHPQPRTTWEQRGLSAPEAAFTSPALRGARDLCPRAGPGTFGLGQREQAGATGPQQRDGSPTRWLREGQRAQVPAPGRTATQAGAAGEPAPTGTRPIHLPPALPSCCLFRLNFPFCKMQWGWAFSRGSCRG